MRIDNYTAHALENDHRPDAQIHVSLQPTVQVSSTGSEDMKDADLISAAGRGDLQRVYELLYCMSVNPNVKNASGTIALIQATLNGCENLGVIDLLLNSNVDVNAATADGLTALMIAVLKGSETVVHRLINAGANIYARDMFSYNALDFAGHLSHVNITNILREAHNVRMVQNVRENMPLYMIAYTHTCEQRAFNAS